MLLGADPNLGITSLCMYVIQCCIKQYFIRFRRRSLSPDSCMEPPWLLQSVELGVGLSEAGRCAAGRGNQAHQPGAVIGWQSPVGSVHDILSPIVPIPLPCLLQGSPKDQKGWGRPLRDSKGSTPPGAKASCRAQMSTRKPSGSIPKSVITPPAFPD